MHLGTVAKLKQTAAWWRLFSAIFTKYLLCTSTTACMKAQRQASDHCSWGLQPRQRQAHDEEVNGATEGSSLQVEVVLWECRGRNLSR